MLHWDWCEHWKEFFEFFKWPRWGGTRMLNNWSKPTTLSWRILTFAGLSGRRSQTWSWTGSQGSAQRQKSLLALLWKITSVKCSTVLCSARSTANARQCKLSTGIWPASLWIRVKWTRVCWSVNCQIWVRPVWPQREPKRTARPTLHPQKSRRGHNTNFIPCVIPQAGAGSIHAVTPPMLGGQIFDYFSENLTQKPCGKESTQRVLQSIRFLFFKFFSGGSRQCLWVTIRLHSFVIPQAGAGPFMPCPRQCLEVRLLITFRRIWRKTLQKGINSGSLTIHSIFFLLDATRKDFSLLSLFKFFSGGSRQCLWVTIRTSFPAWSRKPELGHSCRDPANAWRSDIWLFFGKFDAKTLQKGINSVSLTVHSISFLQILLRRLSPVLVGHNTNFIPCVIPQAGAGPFMPWPPPMLGGQISDYFSENLTQKPCRKESTQWFLQSIRISFLQVLLRRLSPVLVGHNTTNEGRWRTACGRHLMG